MASFTDFLNWTEPTTRPILLELQRRISALPSVKENVTKENRITYSVARIFAEVKVQKKLILVRFFDMGISDPQNLVRHVHFAKKQNWQHDKEIRVTSMPLVDYAMSFIEAYHRSHLTRSPPVFSR